MCQTSLKLNFNCIRIKLFDAILKMFGILRTSFQKHIIHVHVFLWRYQFYYETWKHIFYVSSYVHSLRVSSPKPPEGLL
jgi:hypothetical protein